MKKYKKVLASICPIGKEHYEVYWKDNDQKVKYEYRDKDGELFSCLVSTLDDARDARNDWLRIKKHKNDKQYTLDDVVLYPDDGNLVPVIMKDNIPCAISQHALEKFLSEALQQLKTVLSIAKEIKDEI